MGADPTLQNNVGKTPLMEMILYRMKENVIKMCLEKTPDVNKTDKFGSTCLHYAAWANADVSIVKLLKEFGAQVFEDCNGNLPCTIAEQRGYNELVVELCQCMNWAHEDKKILNGTGTYCFEDLYTQKRLLKEPLAGTINVFELLNTPFTGSVTSVNEADEIKNAVIDAVTGMCSKIAEKDALLNNTVVVSGSVSEDTKVGLPDEFDFCCLIDPITEAFEDDERKSSSDPDYAYLRLKENFRDSPLREMVDNDGYLLSHLILMRFMNVLREVLNIDLSSVINNSKLRLKSEYRSFYLYGPNVTFTLNWTGPFYKDIIIGIDLVPAIKLSKWPPGSRLNSLVVDLNKLPQGAMGLLQKIERESPESKIRVSASRAEYMYMRELPQIARDAYMVAKILLSEQICPTIYLTPSDQTPIKHNIISYYLKTCMFHIFQEPFLQDMKSFDYRTSAFKEKENKLNECVVEIFKRLAECTKSKRLPGFIFPWQNIFEVFRFEHLNTNYFKDRHVAIENACVNRTIFARLILNMLGEKVDLSLDFS